MAYRCPVCSEPQVDAEHLANHMAFTAMIREGDHESWLGDTVPGWTEGDDDELAARLREELDTVEHPIDDIETHDHGEGHGHSHPAAGHETGDDRALDGEAADILAEAREMTERMAEDEPETE
jgi:hypothetical protein